MGLEFHCIQVSSFQGVGIEEFHCTQVSSFHGVGVPLYTGVSFQGVGLEEFPCIQRSPHLKESAPKYSHEGWNKEIPGTTYEELTVLKNIT